MMMMIMQLTIEELWPGASRGTRVMVILVESRNTIVIATHATIVILLKFNVDRAMLWLTS